MNGLGPAMRPDIMLGKIPSTPCPNAENAMYGPNSQNAQIVIQGESTPNIRSVFLRNSFSARPGFPSHRSKHHSVKGLMSTPVNRV